MKRKANKRKEYGKKRKRKEKGIETLEADCKL